MSYLRLRGAVLTQNTANRWWSEDWSHLPDSKAYISNH